MDEELLGKILGQAVKILLPFFFFFYRVGTVSNSESLSGSQNTGLKDELSLIPRNKQDTRGKYVF